MILKLENVRKKRGEGYELCINSFNVAPKEHVAIIGPSGCGKSTTLDIIGMVLEPSSIGNFLFSPLGKDYDIGQVWQNGPVSSLTELRRQHLGYVLQTGEIFVFLNVRENIELTALAAGLDQVTASQRAQDLIVRLELTRLASSMPATLSIGERQRVAIARALAPGPCLLLADEPTSALDPGMSRRVMTLMLETVKDYGASLIMVSHDLILASEFAFREAPIRTKSTGIGIQAILNE